MNVRLDADLIIKEVSIKFLEITYLSSSELLGLNFLDCLHDNIPETCIERFIQSSKFGIDGRYIFQMHINNRDFWFLVALKCDQDLSEGTGYKLDFYTLDNLSIKNAKVVYELEKFNTLIAEAEAWSA